ncbi:phosphate regulon transcriptional regulator PhoB [Endozoicomonas sp. G2_2]|uniref:phosphate regulon transcriptional regulator PhoB n=1 Tax=Gammaproteobacteria TaxID=1236 RepID=UPI000C50578C|nr:MULTISPECIES: phosphate regulon transcriptional regulator PhoB [Gammaproteobacteria]MAS10865.1 phosphate regulon transcriptional regulatory protein PhoB [Salinisphaera sp.]MBO9468965.1 phosphate regulon transcriptional regulator PhoB [Endozoicomonas sp. G2_2]
MQHKHVLIVEDEAPIRDMIRFALERSDFTVSEAEDAQEARLAIAERRPDLVLLDWMLPGVSGAEFARELRRDELTADLAIIMVTARVDADDRVRGLNLGADDYVTKPFSSSELVARVRAVLRRSLPGGEDETLELDGLTLDAASQRVAAGDSPVKLGPTEYRLLRFFMSNPERVYSREQMLDRVWGQNVFVEERTVDVHIRRLRKALAPFGFDHFIQTVRGSGYRFSSKAV